MQQVADAGDIAVNPFDLAEAITTIERASNELRADGTKLITLGGDHTIALPLLRSLHRDHGPIAVLHFDAHLDTWDTYFGAPFTHGTPFRRASEEGLLDPEHCLHVGIRGPLYSSEDLADDSVLGFQVIGSDDYQLDGLAAVIERMRARLGDAPVYVSVDIDVLDPAHAPGTGTPEAGGMTSRELLHSLRGLVGREHRGRRHRRGRPGLRPRRDHRHRRRARRLRAAVRAGHQAGSLTMSNRNGGAAVVETLAAHGVDSDLRHPRHAQPGALPALRQVRHPRDHAPPRAGRRLRGRGLRPGQRPARGRGHHQRSRPDQRHDRGGHRVRRVAADAGAVPRHAHRHRGP